MKHILKYFCLVAFLSFNISCEEPREFNANEQPVVRFTTDSPLSGGVMEGCDPLTYRLEIPFIKTSAIAKISFDGTAVYGTDFTVSGSGVSNATASGFELSMSADEGLNVSYGEFVIQFPEDNDTDGAKTLQMSIIQASGGGLTFKGGDWTGAWKRASTGIADKDDVDFSGTYSAVTTNANPADCEGVEHVITLTRIAGDEYEISDITGGIYGVCYGDGDNTGNIFISLADGITFQDVPDVIYGGDVFNGGGSISDMCSFTLAYTWSNGFGDAGTTTLIKN